MSDVSALAPVRSRLQGLLLPREIEIWTGSGSGASFTEQSPIPGAVTAAQDSYLVPVPSGTPTGTSTYELRVQHGGLPGTHDHGLTVATRRTGDLWLGWDTPGILTNWEAIDWSAITTTTEADAITLANGKVIAVSRTATTIYSYTRPAAGGSWAAAVTVYAGGENVYWPALVEIEGTVYCLAWRRGLRDSGSTSLYYISVWASTDDGATWSMVQDRATVDEDVYGGTPGWGTGLAPYYAHRIRAAYRDGQVLVLAGVRKDDGESEYVRQFAGPALTQRLDTIGTFQDPTPLGWALPDCVATPEGFTVCWVERTSGTEIAAISSAWQPINTANVLGTAGSADGSYRVPAGGVNALTADAGNSLVYDPAGILYLVVHDGDNGVFEGRNQVFYSPDGGTTLISACVMTDATGSLATGAGNYWSPYDRTGTEFDNYSHTWGACWWRGTLLVIGNNTAGSASYGGSLCVEYLGGWSDLPRPWNADGIFIGDRSAWQITWLPYERPDDQDYVVTSGGGGGVSSAALHSSATHRITTGDGAGNSGDHYYTWTGTAITALQIGDGEIDMTCDQSESTTGSGTAYRARLADANNGVEFGFEFCGDRTHIRDVNSGTLLATISSLTPGTFYTYRYGFSINTDTGAGRQLQVWYRVTDWSEKREWTRVGNWTLTDDAGVGGAVPHVEWGHLVPAGAATQQISRWRRVCFTAPRWSGTGATWYDLDQAGGDNPSELPGRPCGTAQMWLLDGVTLGCRRGPGLIGESWTWPISGEYDIDRAISLTTPSFRIHHRTTNDVPGAAVVIPWAVDADRPLTEDAEHPPLMAAFIQCNWRLANLQYRTVAGAWTNAAAIDTRVLQGVSFTRTGKYLRASTTASTAWLMRDEAGPLWTCQWDNGAGTTRYRHLAGNDEGRWSSATTEPRARLELASTLAGDPTSGGTLSLWSPHVLVIVAGVTASAWRLSIDNTYPTADGDYRTKILWGEFFPFAQPPSWGRGFSALPGHELVELEGGLGVGLVRSPPSQELRLAWDEGVDTTEAHGTSEVRFVTGDSTGGTVPAAAVGALPYSLVGALERIQHYPVVWGVWARTTAGAIVLRRRHELFPGTIVGAPDLEVNLGEEGSTEVQRIGTVTLRRVV